MRCPSLADLPPPPAGRTGWPWTEESPRLPDAQPDGRPWPRISIVTPSYNQGRFIEETIRSILLQGYPDLEYVVMDGGSTDESVAIIRKYEKWISRWVSEKDGGQSAAINKGMALATGEWANWINSDDMLARGALGELTAVLCKAVRVDVVSLATRVITEDGASPFLFSPSQVNGATDFFGQWLMPIPQPSTFVRRTDLQVDETLHYCMDWALYFVLAATGRTFVKSPATAAYFRQHTATKTEQGGTRFEREKIRFVRSRQGQLATLQNEIKVWARAREARMALNEQSHTLAKLSVLVLSHPVLLRDRMFWGKVKSTFSEAIMRT